MKAKSKLQFMGLVSALVLFAFSCTQEDKVEQKEEKVEDARQDLQKAENEYAEEVAELRREADTVIARNQARIDELRMKSKERKKEMREDYNKRIEDLEQKNRDMRRRLDEYKDSGKDNWENFKREFRHDMDELGAALKDIGDDNVK